MLIEIWERLRGYDKWEPAQAKVESSQVEETAHPDRSGNVTYTYDSADVLVWVDRRGVNQRAYFHVPDDSPLYQVIDGEMVAIRFNPANPEQYYLRELLQTRVHTVVKLASVTLLFIGIVLLGGWLRARYLLR
jgi:hypothetical protein